MAPLNAEGFAAGEIALALFVLDGELETARLARESGQGFELERDPGTRVALFRLRPSDVVRPGGQPLDAAAFDALNPCLDGVDCGPCTIPSPGLPQMAIPGDACSLSSELPGALYDETGSCITDPSGVLCPPGGPAAAEELAAARAQIRLRRPGRAAPLPPPSPSLELLAITPLAPGNPPNPMQTWTAGHGRVVGIGDQAAVEFDEQQGNLRVVPFESLRGRPRAAAPLDRGFVVAAAQPLPWRVLKDAYFRIDQAPSGEILAPRALDWNPDVIVGGMLSHNGAVWVHGAIPALGGFAGALSVCIEGLGCRSPPFEGCFRLLWLQGLVKGPADVGVAFDVRNILVGSLDPEDRNPWRCHVLPDAIEQPGAEPVRLRRLRVMASRPEGLYACGEVDVDACEPGRAVVLTSSTVNPPRWQVAWTGPSGPTCRALLPIPGRSDGVRIRLDAQLFDLVPGSGVVEAPRVDRAWGTVEGASYTGLLPGDRLLLYGPGNRVHLVRPDGPVQLTGAPEPRVRSWVAAEPQSGGGFWLLEESEGLFSARADGALEPRALPSALDGARFRLLARDPGRRTLLVVTSDGRYALVAEDRSTTAITGSLPMQGFGSPKRAATMGPSGFLVLDDQTRAARIVGNIAEPLAIEFDDPATIAVERAPDDIPAGACGGRPRPADAWQSAAGGPYAAWAGGDRGLLVRFTAQGGIRKGMPVVPDLKAIRVDRPERLIVAGRGPNPSTEQSLLRFQVWGLDLDGGWATEPVERHAFAIETSGIGELINGEPSTLLLEEVEGALSGTPVLFTTGYLHRLGLDQRFTYRRLPFDPRGAAMAENGALLFFAGDGQLAAARP